MPSEDVEHYKNAIAMPGALTGSLNYYRAVVWNTGVLKQNKLMRQARKLNPTYKMPVLVVLGDSDPAILPNLLRHGACCICDACRGEQSYKASGNCGALP